ncbi:MAG TPA: nucleotidyl transferase AbiEii/AbiGii toxin family protein [Candidatus Paceibacterota bacterium]
MTLHRETITDAMRTIAEIVSARFDSGYYLAGGTALALRIGHRQSVDLDYFINAAIDTTVLKALVRDAFAGHDVAFPFETTNTLWCSIDGVKVSFISRFDPLLEPVEMLGGIRVASLEDITVMKLAAICGREEYKDYFDLACLANATDPRAWIGWWQSAYPRADYTSFLVALGAADSVPNVQLMVFGACQNTDVVATLARVTADITAFLKQG